MDQASEQYISPAQQVIVDLAKRLAELTGLRVEPHIGFVHFRIKLTHETLRNYHADTTYSIHFDQKYPDDGIIEARLYALGGCTTINTSVMTSDAIARLLAFKINALIAEEHENGGD